MYEFPSRPLLERALDALSWALESTLADPGLVLDGLESRLSQVGCVGGDQFLRPAVVDCLSVALIALDLRLLDWSSLERRRGESTVTAGRAYVEVYGPTETGRCRDIVPAVEARDIGNSA